jgi:PAS domain S-box-containing protein
MTDWSSIATALAERNPRAVVVLDAHGRVQLLNSAMESLLGWPRFEAVGLALGRIGIGPHDKASSRRWLGDVLRGATRDSDIEATTRSGQRVRLSVEVSLVGAGDGVNVMVVVRHAEPVAGDTTGSPVWVDVEILRDARQFGIITAFKSGGPEISGAVGRRCYELMHSRTEPCQHCPVLQNGDVPWPRTSVSRDGTGQAVYLVRAEAPTETHARLSAVRLDLQSLQHLVRWRIDEVASSFQLTSRERAVISEVVLGRSSDEIAHSFGIAKRTVKFHQANAIAKLGIHARSELMDLVLDGHARQQ